MTENEIIMEKIGGHATGTIDDDNKRIVKIKFIHHGTYCITPYYIETIYKKKMKIVFRAEWENMAVEKELSIPNNKIEKVFSKMEKAIWYTNCEEMCDAEYNELTVFFENHRSYQISVVGELSKEIYEVLGLFNESRNEFYKWSEKTLEWHHSSW